MVKKLDRFDLNYNEKWVQVGQVPTACLAAVKLTYLLYFPSQGSHPQVHLLPALEDFQVLAFTFLLWPVQRGMGNHPPEPGLLLLTISIFCMVGP